MGPARPIFDHLLQPMSAVEYLAWIKQPALKRVNGVALDKPGWQRTRRNAWIDGAVGRLRRFAELYDADTGQRWSDLTIAQAHLARWKEPVVGSTRRNRRRSRLLARAERGLEWLEKHLGVLVTPAVQWIPEERLEANLNSAAVLGFAIGYRRFNLFPDNAVLDAMVDGHRPDWEVVASGYPSRQVLSKLSHEERGRWLGRVARVLEVLPPDWRYQWGVHEFFRTCRALHLGRLLTRWCPPPSRHYKPLNPWKVLPTPPMFFRGDRCTVDDLMAVGPLPPEWTPALRGMPTPPIGADLLRGLHSTAPNSLREAFSS